MCAAKNGNTPLIDSKKCASRAPGACFIPPERFDAMVRIPAIVTAYSGRS
jgi:hypothetical protein